VTLLTFESDEYAVVKAALNYGDHPGWLVGEHFPLTGDSISERVRRSGGPARIDDYQTVSGEIAERLRELGVRSGAGAPLIVDGRTRGVLVVGAHGAQSIPDTAEAHIGDFADLISTAIANAETRAELTASRARIVAAADEARRGFERDLHDGAQQRIVSLSLQLREAEAAAEGDVALRAQLSNVVDGLAGLHSDLQELSRGLHPAVLSRGGLRPAMRNLARRSTVPVELVVDVDRRLPEPVEVAAYYVVAESLTNIAKHANAESVTVEVGLSESASGTVLNLSVTDDGVGGALSGAGSGLVGLRDRVEALSGHLAVTSHPGDGTSVSATIPIPG
jgi:signal transduction histidine kinase